MPATEIGFSFEQWKKENIWQSVIETYRKMWMEKKQDNLRTTTNWEKNLKEKKMLWIRQIKIEQKKLIDPQS